MTSREGREEREKGCLPRTHPQNFAFFAARSLMASQAPVLTNRRTLRPIMPAALKLAALALRASRNMRLSLQRIRSQERDSAKPDRGNTQNTAPSLRRIVPFPAPVLRSF